MSRVDRAVRRVRPRCLVLVETEIWPGLLRAVHAVGSPIVVVSGVSPADAAEKLGFGDSLAPPDAYIEKPVELPRFLATVGELLSGSRKHP